MEATIFQVVSDKMRRESLAKTERLIRKGCSQCGESMFYEDAFGNPIPRGILVVNNSGVECDGSVMSLPVSSPVCYACADRLGINYKPVHAEAEAKGFRWNEPGNCDIRGDVQASLDRVKTGAVAVALEDSQPDGDHHKVKVSLIDGSYRDFDARQFKDTRLVGERMSLVRLTDGTVWTADHSTDEVLEIVRAAIPVAPADSVAKTPTITLRDQLALNASPEYVKKRLNELWSVEYQNFPTEAEVRYVIADEMLKARGE